MIKQDVYERNFIPFIMLHEFESIVLINPNLLLDEIDGVNVDDLNVQIIGFSSPEDINHGKSTAPSKRIIKVVPQYKKIIHGINIAQSLGIEEIRSKCPHFDKWICDLTSMQTD